jgi:hypothetical protein
MISSLASAASNPTVRQRSCFSNFTWAVSLWGVFLASQFVRASAFLIQDLQAPQRKRRAILYCRPYPPHPADQTNFDPISMLGSNDANGLDTKMINGAENATRTVATSASLQAEEGEETTIKNGSANPEKPPRKNLYDYAVGTLGDIMSRGKNGLLATSPTTPFAPSESMDKRDGLITTATPEGTLASRFGIHNPLDRMALTANGNLQRLVSSFYDAPVEVLVDYCELQDSKEWGSARPTPLSPLYLVDNGRQSKGSSSSSSSSSHHAKTWDRVVHLMVHNQV